MYRKHKNRDMSLPVSKCELECRLKNSYATHFSFFHSLFSAIPTQHYKADGNGQPYSFINAAAVVEISGEASFLGLIYFVSPLIV